MRRRSACGGDVESVRVCMLGDELDDELGRLLGRKRVSEREVEEENMMHGGGLLPCRKGAGDQQMKGGSGPSSSFAHLFLCT